VRYDADTGPHHHFVCSECGALTDFTFVPAAKAAKLCEAFGAVASVELSVHGVCGGCSKKRK
jgi:Fe2+ or Zn2+ uptake regulation protein